MDGWMDGWMHVIMFDRFDHANAKRCHSLIVGSPCIYLSCNKLL